MQALRGAARLATTHGIALGIPIGVGLFLGCFHPASTACTAACFGAWGAPSTPSWWGGYTSDGPLGATTVH